MREQVVAFVDEGHGHREAARHFRVSPKFVNDMIKLRRETGGLAPKHQGNKGRARKLQGLEDWVRGRLAEKSVLTLDELCRKLAAEHSVHVYRSAVGRRLHRLSFSHNNAARQRAEAA